MQGYKYMKHLKPKQEYIDFYDSLTVKHCWAFEKDLTERFRQALEKIKDKKDYDEYMRVALTTIDVALYFKKCDAWEKKERIINEWMKKDEERDQLIENAKPIQGVKCLKCHTQMECTSTDLHTNLNKPDQIMFWYECPACKTRRVFYDNGEEYIPKDVECSKCGNVMQTKRSMKDNIMTVKHTCKSCGHTQTEKHDYNKKTEPIDPDYNEKRKRYVLSDEEGQRYLAERPKLESVSELIDKMNEKDKNKELYNKVDKLNKLKITELQELLNKKLTQHNYINLDFKAPEIDKNVIVSFTIQDNKSDRDDMSSQYDLKKLIKKTLINTNWRLMSDGVNYRLGILRGRLRGYEREEDLLKLLKKSLT